MNNLLMNQIKLNGVLGLSILGCGFLSYNQRNDSARNGSKAYLRNEQF